MIDKIWVYLFPPISYVSSSYVDIVYLQHYIRLFYLITPVKRITNARAIKTINWLAIVHKHATRAQRQTLSIP